MVGSIYSALALLALSTTVAAAPASETTSSPDIVQTPSANAAEAVPFSFVTWAKEIKQNPWGEHLTPSQAVEAKNATVQAVGSLKKRATCATNFANADAVDAASCVYFLATLGVSCDIRDGTSQSSALMCRMGAAEIRGSKVNPSGPAQGVSCYDIAITAGKIFDDCWEGDGTVKGNEIVDANRQMQVNVLRPYRLGF